MLLLVVIYLLLYCRYGVCVVSEIKPEPSSNFEVMSLAPAVVCVDCKCTESSFWHKNNGSVLCTTCYCRRDGINRSTRSQASLSSNSTPASSRAADEPRSADNSVSVVRSGSANITRKSSRLKPLAKNKPWQSVVKLSSVKGRSKRFVFLSLIHI